MCKMWNSQESPFTKDAKWDKKKYDEKIKQRKGKNEIVKTDSRFVLFIYEKRMCLF